MNFNELKAIMIKNGISSLSEIARQLDTTPQAVSNWKSRNQIPYHIVDRITNSDESQNESYQLKSTLKDNTIFISDILLMISQQIKIIFLTIFITVFMSFTYVEHLLEPKYESYATILLPEKNNSNDLGGLANLATQFGVNMPTNPQVDLSSPSLFSELIYSRTFAEKILNKSFYTQKYGKKLPLLAILTYGDILPEDGVDTLVTKALIPLGEILDFNQSSSSALSSIRVTTSEAAFSKQLADSVLNELEKLNLYYRNLSVRKKISFIENRILSAKNILQDLEQKLKRFNEENRQISSPSLQLELERRTREVEVQKGIYLTLRQQLELANIEEVQEASIVQVLDRPHIALKPSNKSLRTTILLSGIFGVFMGVFIGLIRSYFNSNDILERRKHRRARNFLKKKSKEVVLDRRITGIISALLLAGFPLYFNKQIDFSSLKFLVINVIYIFILSFSLILFLYYSFKKK